ncbi:hypothetical protein [Agrobacterium tumefaciens]|uniref:hypothetical protein n=1 Tax=Agrobacterium tumefaciens TaxID=358 RepID=UPI0021D0D8C3|nr:hypothetical protein [Agrobacterium tumefaciens]
MNNNTQTTPEIVSARLTLDVAYLLNGESASEMLERMRGMCERAIGEGMLTGETAAEVDAWSIAASLSPTAAADDTLEAGIAAFMRQRIEDGNLDAEDIPVRLSRYGLMPPEAFVSEMRERMDIVDGDDLETQATVAISAAPSDHDEFEMRIAVACVNASGMSDMPLFTVRITREEFDLGVHYDKAKDLAEEARYEEPFVCFDATEQNAILSAARKLGSVRED